MTRNDAILVVGPSWVGDMVMAQSLFKTLKFHQPTQAIDVLAPEWTLPLLACMPEVRQGIVMPVGHQELGMSTRFHLGRLLKGQYDQAILLPNSLKSALVPFFAAIPTRTGFLGELRWGLLNDIRPLDKTRLPRTVDRFVNLALPANTPLPNPIPLPELRASPIQGEAMLTRFGLQNHHPLLVLCPGAEYGPAKRWPTEHFNALARTKQSAGWNIVILGSTRETQMGEEILSGIDHQGVNLAGRIRLAEAVNVLACASAVVTNDSGLMHVAAALNRTGVAIFGSSDPCHTPPLGGCLTVLSLGLACAPCFKRLCPKKHYECLHRITPAMVLERL